MFLKNKLYMFLVQMSLASDQKHTQYYLKFLQLLQIKNKNVFVIQREYN